MFAPSLATAVGVFAPAALPAFSAIPTPIPATPPFARLPFGRQPILDPSQIPSDQELKWLPGLFSITLCCSMPSATPGVEALARPANVRSCFQGLRCLAVSPLPGECLHRAAHCPNPSFAAPASVACVYSHSFGHSNWTFEATYRIQLLSLHLATFPPPATLAAGFGYGRLTILTRRASHPLDGEPFPGSQLSSCAPPARPRWAGPLPATKLFALRRAGRGQGRWMPR